MPSSVIFLLIALKSHNIWQWNCFLPNVPERVGNIAKCTTLRLVFTSDEGGVGVVSGVARVLMTWWKSKIGVCKPNHKSNGIRVGRIRTFPFLPTPLTTPLLTFGLWSKENQIVGVGSRSGRINQSQCTFPCFVIGLVLLLLLPTLTIWFSLEHK